MAAKPFNLLVIDDSPTFRRTLELYLEPAGYHIEAADNGVSGIQRAFQMLPDLIISDVIMPELNGYQLCRLAKSDDATRDTPVVLLTSLEDKTDRFWAKHAGADAYIQKTEVHTELIPTVERLLAGRTPHAHRKRPSEELAGDQIKSRVSYLLDRLLFESTIENECRRLASFVHDRAALVEQLHHLLGSLVDCTHHGLLLQGRRGSQLFLQANEPVTRGDHDSILEEMAQIGGVQAGVDETEVIIDESVPLDKNDARRTIQGGLVVPIQLGTLVLGSLGAFSTRSTSFPRDTKRVMELLATDLATVVQLLFLYEENRFLSITDPLTQAYNRRYFTELLEREVDRSRRYKNPLSLLFVDLDNFKRLNDTRGHEQGDIVLQEVAKLLRASLRKVDVVARYGGEEFVVLLPETSLAVSRMLAERLRFMVEHYPFDGPGGAVRITASIGVAEFHESTKDRTRESLLRVADEAMYRAKNSGKNKVEAAAPA